MGRLYPHQKKAVSEMFNGCILRGGVGSGKSRTAIAYYCKQCDGSYDSKKFVPMKRPKRLYIITTAKKRDDLEWWEDINPFLVPENLVTVDSWQNIKKYIDVKGAFFIFDEQRLIGSGAWVKAFYQIYKKNEWILLSATPGDEWVDYIPVFVAHGFYRNKTDFEHQHVVFSPYVKYRSIQRYVGTKRLEDLRDSITVYMDSEKPAEQTHIYQMVEYDKALYKGIMKKRWDPFKQQPIQNAGGLYFLLRKVTNSDPTRAQAVLDIFKNHPKAIIFYNYNYELDILRELPYGKDVIVREWNGKKHEPIPDSKRWVYLVQYTSGREGWNCITTDTIIFFSEHTKYRTMIQAAGRTDRVNTKFKILYNYHLVSKSPIDLSIRRSLKSGKDFNKRKFFGKEFTNVRRNLGRSRDHVSNSEGNAAC